MTIIEVATNGIGEARSLESDAFTYNGHLIWGLSLMMIDELLEIVGSRKSDSAKVERA